MRDVKESVVTQKPLKNKQTLSPSVVASLCRKKCASQTITTSPPSYLRHHHLTTILTPGTLPASPLLTSPHHLTLTPSHSLPSPTPNPRPSHAQVTWILSLLGRKHHLYQAVYPAQTISAAERAHKTNLLCKKGGQAPVNTITGIDQIRMWR